MNFCERVELSSTPISIIITLRIINLTSKGMITSCPLMLPYIQRSIIVKKGPRSKDMVTTCLNMVKTSVLEPQLHSDVPVRNFCQSKRHFRAVWSISEHLRSKGQRLSSPYNQRWGKLQFLFNNCIQCTRWQLSSMKKTY